MKPWLFLPLLLVAVTSLALWLGATTLDLTVGFASGVLAAMVWAYADSHRRRTAHRESISELEGRYHIRMKGDVEGVKSYGIVTIILDGTRLVTKSDGVPPAGAWEGEIVMSEAYPTSGTGAYHHPGRDGWGVQTVQRRGDDLLVHASWVKNRALIVDAFVWAKIPDRDGPDQP